MQILGLFFTNSKDGKQKSYASTNKKACSVGHHTDMAAHGASARLIFMLYRHNYLIRALTTRTLPSEKVSHTILTPLNGVADITPARL